EEEPLQNGLWPILFNPMPRLQDQFAYFDPCRADCLAIAAIKAMVHVAYEFFRRRQSPVYNRLDHGHAAARGLGLYAVGTISWACGEAGPTPHALKDVAIIVDVQGS